MEAELLSIFKKKTNELINTTGIAVHLLTVTKQQGFFLACKTLYLLSYGQRLHSTWLIKYSNKTYDFHMQSEKKVQCTNNKQMF